MGVFLGSLSISYGQELNMDTYLNKTMTQIMMNIESKGKVPVSRGNTYSNRSKIENYNVNAEDIIFPDWWSEANGSMPKGTVIVVQDYKTKKVFEIKRTGGTNHADVEGLTTEDTNIMKDIWGGFSWDRRPVLLYVEDKVYAASMTNMPHAGRDDKKALEWVEDRSDGYGSGINYDSVKENGMDGHVDLHFINSTRHLDGKQDPRHQECINYIKVDINKK
jgi:hypothetical protein